MFRRLFEKVVLNSNRSRPNGARDEQRLEIGEIESLESREMLAGDVEVFVNFAGDVRVVGDAASNDICVFRTPGRLLHIHGNDNTTITHEGNTSREIFLDVFDNTGSIRRNLTIDMNAGNDVVSMADLGINGNLKVQLDQGSDLFDMRTSFVGNNVVVNGGGGRYADYLSIESVSMLGNLKMNAGASALFSDTMRLGSVLVAGNSTLVGSANGHQVLIDGVVVLGDSRISTGQGDDSVDVTSFEVEKASSISTGSGHDLIELGALKTVGDFRVSAGSGNDVMRFVENDGLNSEFLGAVRYSGGSGIDELALRGDTIYASFGSPVMSQFEFVMAIFGVE